MTQKLPSNNTSSSIFNHKLEGLIGVLRSANTQEELFHTVCTLGCEVIGGSGVALLARFQGTVKVVASSHLVTADSENVPSWLTELARSYGQILAENCQIVVLATSPSYTHGIFVPLGSNEQGSFVLAAYLQGKEQMSLQNASDTLQLLRTILLCLENSSQQNNAPKQISATENTENIALLDVIDIIGDVQESTRFFEACVTLCAKLSGKFGCRRVALGHIGKMHIKAIALDQMDTFARGTRSVRQIEEVMHEAVDQNRMLHFSTTDDAINEPGVIIRATRELAVQSNARRIITIPLRESRGCFFVIVLIMDGDTFTPKHLDALNLICRLLAPRLRDLQLAEEIPLKKTGRYLSLKSKDVFGPHHTVLKIISILFGVLLALTLLISGNIVISAPIVIEGVHSYTHTAPMDSYLFEVRARPGDEVAVGDVLALLDATEINMEIAALKAQKQIYKSQADQYLQEGKNAEATIARLEAKRAEANLAWAYQRLDMTELKSNVDGYIISEDMFSRLGQPVRRGQELFEITDTASLRVIIQVDETDIRDMNKAMAQAEVQGKFTLTAYPDTQIPFTVERIHPFATVVESINSFELRGQINTIPQNIVLRPGMEGYARIVAGERPLLVLWTRKLINKVRLLLWKWF